MYLKSLTLKGFKSFAQPTTFAFEPGVTCVVGPNGSGKSNVVDALAWVMGEQGVKTLRGGKMEDVIFAGTSTRGPLGRAEVILTIDNSDGALPIEYSEVTISRTLFRNGASEYAINGRTCRLLDVQELLSDSGLGREMHVIVGQGQLDAVLRATPEERRGFIEEAAGILKHRRRKEKTLRKLDAMQTNLTRLSDLAGEIRRQLKPLGRQADIAREAQTIAAVVRDARARLLADDVVLLRAALDAHNHTESERHTERVVLQEQLAQKQGRVQRLELAQVGDAVDLARRTSFGLESVQERLRGLFTLANQRLALLGSQAEPTGPAFSVTPAMLTDAAAEVEQLRASIGTAETAWGTAREQSAAARSQLDAVDDDIAAQAALVTRHDLEISQLTGQSETARSRLAAVRGEQLRQQNALDAAFDRSEKAQSQLAELETAVTEAAEEPDSDDLSEALALAQTAVQRVEADVERLRDELHQHERERDAQAARQGAFSLALDQKDGSSALLGAQLPGIRGLVADRVRVQPGFEAAIAAALGSLADAVLADNREAALEAIGHAHTDDLGRVELLIADGADTLAPGVDSSVDLGAGIRWATSVVDGPAGVRALLAQTVIADDLAVARAAQLTDTVTIITLVGEVLGPWVVRGGSGARPSKLELVAERDTAAEKLTTVTALIERVRFDLGDQRTLLHAHKEQSVSARAAVRALETQLATQTERRGRLTVQADAATADLARVSAALTLATRAVEEVEAVVAEASATLVTAQSRPRPLLDATVRDALYRELEVARDREVEARLQVETARERVRAGEAHVVALTEQLAAEHTAAEAAARRAVIRRRQVDAASRVAEALPAVLAAADRSVAEARLRLASAEAERTSQNTELQQLRLDESAWRERLAAITENVHGLELEIYEKKLHLSALLERAGSELGLTEDVLVAEYGPDQLIPTDGMIVSDDSGADSTPHASGASERAAGERDSDNRTASDRDIAGRRADGIRFNRAEQQKRFAAAERKLGQLGRVNPLALEEFAALEQRHRFLTEQLTDLTETRSDLLTIIADIDEKMQAIFSDAFDDTQAAFAEVFPVLFPGGSGSIWLTDPDDLLTTGIEVSVKPAGKKIERLSLLSGGERSLAAVALLIAIFKARPSPFYIMDEVEAALDDANLGRLLTIFEDLRETSQLIVITHQKRTMEIADALYGVSMRQDGVSAVVGQRVGTRADQRERDREPAAS
ncbi:chromosome segregation protein SMC [Cryobacterium levicorallinum]|uniref:Chromosome partition protein Smc n=1 Tax=Cryobacterium levicorallinum TaxID=995038 RepID=A0A1I3ACV4_9MICO|nr:chromosome segregation protein SMC [Cryobacterium levicorallinum]TFB86506.1 chromosome segregation protein SMC [Cryobacterium levicorallinum]GEP26659.1 chromosome partition protein Smc [Cryobacterium levicorallinum]SFH47924.1 condensin subunit Smc [Cryobacterium levicorallinum]